MVNAQWIDAVIGGCATVMLGGVLLFVLRTMNAEIRTKQDSNACNERHESIKKDFARGERSFDALRNDIRSLTAAQSQTNILLARIDERISAHIDNPNRKES